MQQGTLFTRRTVERHFRKHQARCPPEYREILIERILAKRWTEASLGKVVGIVASTFARHQLTDYDRLLAISGMARAEARLIVSREVSDILESWRSTALPSQIGGASRAHAYPPVHGYAPPPRPSAQCARVA